MELKRCAMVLEGGAVKGIFTSGVLDYLMKRDFYPEYVVGVSAGACNAVDYVSKQPGRTRDCFITRRPDERYLRFSNVFRHRPVYDMDMVFDQFPNKSHPFDFDTFYRSPMKCEMVVTNCLTGKAEYKTPDPDKKKFMDTCRASSSMPFVSPLVMLDHVPYLDGGIADSVPLARAQQLGYEKIVVVLTKNRGYRKEPSRIFTKMAAYEYRKYPKLCQTIARRYVAYNRTMERLEKLEEEGKIFVIRPRMKAIGRMEQDRKKLAAFYVDGYRLMGEQYAALCKYLEK